MKNSRKKPGKLRVFWIGTMGILCAFAVIFLLAQFFLPSQITLMKRDGSRDYVLEIPFFLSTDKEVSEYIEEDGVPVTKDSSNVSLYKKDGQLCLHPVQIGEDSITLRLFGVIPVKNVVVKVLPETTVYAGGDAIGLSLQAGGLVVIDFKDFQNHTGNTCNPAEEAGLQRGDKIVTCNGEEVTDSDDFARLISTGNGKSVTLQYLRQEKTCEVTIKPQLSKEDNLYRLGMWVRDGTDGIGILTFVDKTTGIYGSIGHGIQDTDLEQLCTVDFGFAMRAQIIGIERGVSGDPGELKGVFLDTDHPLGNVLFQDDTGVYGKYFSEDSYNAEDLKKRQELEIGLSFEVETGPATILTTLGNGGIQEYDIMITKVYYNRVNSTKSMMIQVTDEELIAQTGGIVQGMSGSPILQKGKIIGAVTHVLVNDATAGYGIFIESMLNHVDMVAKEN